MEAGTYVARLLLVLLVLSALSAAVYLGDARFCKSNQTTLQQVLQYIDTNIDVFQNQEDSSESTLSDCLKECLDADCEGAVFCNGDCYIIPKDVLDDLQNHVLPQFIQNTAIGLLSINYSMYCVFYEQQTDVSTEVPHLLTTPTVLSTTTASKRELHEMQEEKLSSGELHWLNWDAGTTLEFSIPRDTKGIIRFTPISGDGNGSLVVGVGIEKENGNGIAVWSAGYIAVDSSSNTVVRLRKPSAQNSAMGIQVRFNGSLKGTLDNNYDGEYNIFVNTTNDIGIEWAGREVCGDGFYQVYYTDQLFIKAYVIPEKICPENGPENLWSVGVYHDFNMTSPSVQVLFTLVDYCVTRRDDAGATVQGRAEHQLENNDEILITIALNNNKTVSAWINEEFIDTLDVNTEYLYVYVSGGLTTTDLYYI